MKNHLAIRRKVVDIPGVGGVGGSGGVRQLTDKVKVDKRMVMVNISSRKRRGHP